MKIVITGGAGFIGSNLVHALTRCGDVSEVRVLDDLSTGSKDNLAGTDIELVESTVLDGPALDRAFRGADTIVHLAAIPSVARSVADPLASHHANATGTLMVLEAARRAESAHVIAASSSSVYGANPHLPKHEDLRPAPLSPYAVSKLAAESYLASYYHCHDLPVLPFRFFNVYGPRQPAGHAYAAVVPAWIEAAMTGQQVLVNGDGSQSRDFTYVETVCRVLTQAVLRKFVSADPVNLAFGTRTSLTELVTELEAVLGGPLVPRHLPPRPGDVRHSHADNSRLLRLFPDVQPVPLREGLERTVEWFREHPRRDHSPGKPTHRPPRPEHPPRT